MVRRRTCSNNLRFGEREKRFNAETKRAYSNRKSDTRRFFTAVFRNLDDKYYYYYYYYYYSQLLPSDAVNSKYSNRQKVLGTYERTKSLDRVIYTGELFRERATNIRETLLKLLSVFRSGRARTLQSPLRDIKFVLRESRATGQRPYAY